MTWCAIKYARNELKKKSKLPCQAIKLLLRNFLTEIQKSEKNKRYKFFFNPSEGNKRIAFVEDHFRIPEAKDQPLILMAWQKLFISLLYGWHAKKDYSLRYREAYLQVAKKNGKTTLLAVLLILHLLEQRGHNVCASFATKLEQSAICFKLAKKIIEASPTLRGMFQIKHNTIECARFSSWYKPLTSVVKGEEGVGLTMAIGDEVHHFKNFDMVNMMKGSMVHKKDAQLILITTAGEDPNCIAHTYYREARTILEKPNPKQASRLFCIYELDDTDDLLDTSLWYKANPTHDERGMMKNITDIRSTSMSNKLHVRAFEAKHLNRWPVGGSIDFITEQQWDACKWLPKYEADMIAPKLSADEKKKWIKKGILRMKDYCRLNNQHIVCYCGIDLSKWNDFTAICLLIDDQQMQRRLVKIWQFTCTKKVNEARQTGEPLDSFLDDGTESLRVLGQEEIHKPNITQILLKLNEEFGIKRLVYDPYGSSSIVPELRHHIECVPARSNPYYSIGETRDMVAYGELRHETGPLMKWQLNNVMMKRDAHGNPRISKESDSNKIDGVLALVYAIDAYRFSDIAIARTKVEQKNV